MPTPKLPLAMTAKTDDTGILRQDSRREHMADYHIADICGLRVESGGKPSINVWTSDATFLQCERHHLLCVDMRR